MSLISEMSKNNGGLLFEIDETEQTLQTFSLRKWILLPLLIIVTIICGYFALPTTKIAAVSKSVEQVKDGYVTKNIEDIKAGDIFLGANGELSTLAFTERVEFPEGITVYNFTVADNHNYFVIANVEACDDGVSVVLVHNANMILLVTIQYRNKYKNRFQRKLQPTLKLRVSRELPILNTFKNGYIKQFIPVVEEVSIIVGFLLRLRISKERPGKLLQ
jgi:hypothetical protein